MTRLAGTLPVSAQEAPAWAADCGSAVVGARLAGASVRVQQLVIAPAAVKRRRERRS